MREESSIKINQTWYIKNSMIISPFNYQFHSFHYFHIEKSSQFKSNKSIIKKRKLSQVPKVDKQIWIRIAKVEKQKKKKEKG